MASNLSKLKVPFLAFAIILVVFMTSLFIISANSAETRATQVLQKNPVSEPTPPHNIVESKERDIDIGSVLNEKTVGIIKEREADWKLVKNEWSRQTESTYKIWKSGEKHVTLFLNPFESQEIAVENFEKSRGPLASSLGITGTDVNGFGDKGGILRGVDSVENASFTFCVGRFLVSIGGEKANVLRFAKHFEKVLRTHIERDMIDK